MLVVLFLWIFAGIICFIYGNFTAIFIKKIFGFQDVEDLHFTFYFLLGNVALTAIISMVSIFTNIGLEVNLVIFFFGFILAISK